MNRSDQMKQMTITGVGIALTFLATRLIQIPIPLGYANAGTVMILLFSVYFGPLTGSMAGAWGSALADLVSFPIWAVPTFLIKGLMGGLAGLLIWQSPVTENLVKGRLRFFLGSALAAFEGALGYTLAGMLLYGSVPTGLSQLPSLIMEQSANLLIFFVIKVSLDRTGVMKYVRRTKNNQSSCRS